MNSAQMIFFNRVGVANASGLRNPVVKFALLVAPLLFVVYQTAGRVMHLPRLQLREVVIVTAMLFWASILNFSDRGRARMVRYGCAGAIFFGGIFYVTTHPKSTLTGILGAFSKIYSWIPVVPEIAPETWLYLIVLYTALVTARGFSTREMLWLGRHLLWRYLYVIYAIAVATFATISSALPLRVGLSWRVARDKGALLNNPYLPTRRTWNQRVAKTTALFTLSLIGNNSAIAHAIHLLTVQRGFFFIGYRDVIGAAVSNEDICSSALIAIMIFVLLMGRL